MSRRTPKDLISDTNRAVKILEAFTDPNKAQDVRMLIPANVLANAHGIVFIRLVRIGLLVSAKSGTGIIIARLPDGSWSAPSGVSMTSLGFGHLAGGEVIDSIIVMNYRAAVKAFFDGGGQLQLGAGVSLAAGPLGRSMDVAAAASNANHIAATYAYSMSKGLYFGYSFEGSKISERVNTNAAYYGRPISAREILNGGVPPSPHAQRLYQILASLGAGPRPGQMFRAATVGSSMQKPSSQLQSRPSLMSGHSEPAMGYAGSPSFQQPSPSMPAKPQYPPRPQRPAGSTEPVYSDPPPSYEATMSSNGLKNGGASSPSVTSGKAPPNAVQSQPPLDGPSSSSNGAGPMQDPAMASLVVAKFNYNSQDPRDLTFQAGDHIIVLRRNENRESWWEGEIGTKKGLFPANYTEDVRDD
ncbi:uncharacterized protein BYT42DRAFT_548652 [Radiomyces spectabilis]|uniref:uncharacterized protein n=1 Tax=Radiomyces spectabilis TaxID=64574 RepID=UPI00221F9E4A|nr:uncharacterized protein BYT42DRAFT_548652 [Radiomyces spectabilis]KAI8370373.1 hypothetical protein BYT42DRAFT_548652 [Radiomyces spectabilis]